eukprot:scaffold140924_cov15-Tisochrysis_lutea.AAC.1
MQHLLERPRSLCGASAAGQTGCPCMPEKGSSEQVEKGCQLNVRLGAPACQGKGAGSKSTGISATCKIGCPCMPGKGSSKQVHMDISKCKIGCPCMQEKGSSK